MFSFLFAKKTPATKQPRRYPVPDGLVDTVIGLLEAIDAKYSPRRARKDLWELLEKRCPECKEGRWGVEQDGCHLFLVEKLPQ